MIKYTDVPEEATKHAKAPRKGRPPRSDRIEDDDELKRQMKQAAAKPRVRG